MTTNESSGCYTDFREVQLHQPRSGFLAQRVLAAHCERSWEFLLRAVGGVHRLGFSGMAAAPLADIEFDRAASCFACNPGGAP